MWPALILAANRKDKVKGRTRMLVDSIIIRNGFNQLGAPSGSKWAIVAFIFLADDDIINDIHIGKPIDNVMIRCLDNLKE